MLELNKIDNSYELWVNSANNKKLIGHFVQSESFYYFAPIEHGWWSDVALLEIGKKLKEINKVLEEDTSMLFI